MRGRRIPGVRRAAAPMRASISSARSGAAGARGAPERRADRRAASRRPRSGQGIRGLWPRCAIPAGPPSSWPRRSRATAWARPARPPTPTTSRRRWRIRPCAFRDRFSIPVPDDQLEQIPYIAGARQRRAGLFRRGHPARGRPSAAPSGRPRPAGHAAAGAPRCSRAARAASSRPRWLVRLLGQLLKDPGIGKRVSPSCPTNRAPSAWTPCSARSASIRTWASCTRRRMPTSSCLPRGPPGADPAGRHQRVRRHGILDRGRHGA